MRKYQKDILTDNILFVLILYVTVNKFSVMCETFPGLRAEPSTNMITNIKYYNNTKIFRGVWVLSCVSEKKLSTDPKGHINEVDIRPLEQSVN